MIGPVMKEPDEDMSRFFCRDEFPSLLAYWLHWHMGNVRWRVLCEMAYETGGIVRFTVPGYGVIGGVVPVS